MTDHNNVLDIDQKELESKVFNNLKKLSKRTPKKPLKTPKRHNHTSNHRKASTFEDLGIDNAIPIEERRVYTLEGEIGSKEAHFL